MGLIKEKVHFTWMIVDVWRLLEWENENDVLFLKMWEFEAMG